MHKKEILYDSKLERDIFVLTKNYIKRSAVFDILANFPVAIYFFLYGMPSELEEIEEASQDPIFTTVMAFKTLRLFHA